MKLDKTERYKKNMQCQFCKQEKIIYFNLMERFICENCWKPQNK